MEKPVINTDFTEFSICTVDNQMLKNSSSKSIVFCPFNTLNKQQEVNEGVALLDFAKILNDGKIKYGQFAKGPNREFEKFNNLDFDNGVYHKFAYKNQPTVQRQ